MKRVGILGGTFSPPHKGHLAMATAVLKGLSLDEVIFIPCGDPPHKNSVWNADFRLKMTIALVGGEEHFSVSDMEIKSEGKSYTAKTLKLLKEKNRETTFYFIVGADSLCYMDDWMTPSVIFENAEIAVLGREGYPHEKVEEYIAFLQKKYNAKIHQIDMPRVDVSSSMLRHMLKNKEDISPYTGEEVANIISEHINGNS